MVHFLPKNFFDEVTYGVGKIRMLKVKKVPKITFNVLIFSDAIGKITLSKCLFFQQKYFDKVSTYAVFSIITLSKVSLGTLSMFLFYLWSQKRSDCQKSNLSDFWRCFWWSDFCCSDCTFGVLIFLIFDILIAFLTFWTFLTFDVLVVGVLTPSHRLL